MARRSPPIEQFNVNANVAANFARPPMDDGSMAIAAGRAVSSIGGLLARLAKAGEDKALAASVAKASEQGATDAAASVGMPKVTDNATGDYFARLRQIESSGNDRAVNPNSGAAGRYQFIAATAKQYGITDPFDVSQQEAGVRRFTEDNRRALAKSLGREPTPGELYLAHQQGAAGAAKLLANPDADAASIVGSQAIAQNGGRPGMTAGEFARQWVAKFEGGRSVTLPEIKPLQLRKDGTPQGEAYDAALLKAGGYRAKVAMTTGLDALGEQFADDPAGFDAEADKLRQSYVEAFGAAPELQATADAEFELNAGPIRRQIYDRRDRAAEAAMKQAAAEAVNAQGSLLEKQAYGLGVNTDGDAHLNALQQRANTVIDSALAAGAISPGEASRQREAIVGRLVQARFDGVFDALQSPAEKQAFADQLATPDMRDDLLQKMPLEQYRQIAARYNVMARQATEAQGAETRLEQQRFAKLLDDDLASVTATGKGVAVGGLPLAPAEVERVLGPEKTAGWMAARAEANKLFAATDGLMRLTPEQIEQRMAEIAPEAGAEGFAAAQGTYSRAAKVADGILRRRAEDPAAAVDEAFGLSTDEALQAEPAKLAEARMMRQAALGIPELARQPLTNAEATRMAQRLILYQNDGQAQQQVVQSMVTEMGQTFGEYGDDAMAQVLRVNGVSRDMSALMVQAAAKINLGQPVTQADARAMDRAMARDAAASAMAGTPPAGRRSPEPGPQRRSINPSSRPQPATAGKAAMVNAAAVEHLRANPQLAPEFEKHYGAGLAENYLAAPQQEFRARTLPDGSRELVYENGWVEIMKPDGSIEGSMSR